MTEMTLKLYIFVDFTTVNSTELDNRESSFLRNITDTVTITYHFS